MGLGCDRLVKSVRSGYPVFESRDLVSLERQLSAIFDRDLEQIERKAEIRHPVDHPKAP